MPKPASKPAKSSKEPQVKFTARDAQGAIPCLLLVAGLIALFSVGLYFALKSSV